jgi:hypothetical protein
VSIDPGELAGDFGVSRPRLGQCVLDLLPFIAALRPEIDQLGFVIYPQRKQSAMAALDRLTQSSFKDLMLKYTKLAEEFANPAFPVKNLLPTVSHWGLTWGSVLAKGFDTSTFGGVINTVAQHNFDKTAERRFRLKAGGSMRDEAIAELEDTRKNDTSATLGVCSASVMRDGTEGYLPLMDLRCPTESYFVQLATEAFRSLSPEGGVLVSSGKSLHFYGFEVLTRERWLTFMARCLLLAPLTDDRFIAHSLLDRDCTLRISARPEGEAPHVISIV